MQRAGQALGYPVELLNLENLRNKVEHHYYSPSGRDMLDLSAQPHYPIDKVKECMFRSAVLDRDDICNGVISCWGEL